MMKTLMTVLLSAGTLVLAQEPQQQTPEQQQKQKQQRPKQDRQARRAKLDKFNADLDHAATRAQFTEQQKQEFAAARETLQKARASRDTADREAARAAMKKLRDLATSDAFQAEDREMLKKDLRDLRPGHKRKGQGTGAARRKNAAA